VCFLTAKLLPAKGSQRLNFQFPATALSNN